MIKKVFIEAGIFLAVYQLYINIEHLIYTKSIELTFNTDLFFFFILLAIVNAYYQKLLDGQEKKSNDSSGL